MSLFYLDSYTVDDLKEYIKCRDDVSYFSENYLGVKLTANQESAIDLMESSKSYAIETPRRVGKTTLVQVWATWKLTFHMGVFNLSIGVYNSMVARSWQDTFNTFLKNVPKKFSDNSLVTQYESGIIRFKNGNSIRIASMKSPSVWRERSTTHFIGEEAGHPDSGRVYEQNCQDVMPTIDMAGGSFGLISTKHYDSNNLFSGIIRNSRLGSRTIDVLKFAPFSGNINEYTDKGVTEGVNLTGSIGSFLRQEGI